MDAMLVDVDDLEAYFLRREFREPARFRCHDGMCGADDCARCNPGGEVEEDEDEEEEEKMTKSLNLWWMVQNPEFHAPSKAR